MNWSEIEVQWKYMTARLQRHWLRLTDADLKSIDGKRTGLITAIEKRYGVLQEDAERQVRDWMMRLGATSADKRSAPSAASKSGIRPSWRR